MWKRNSTMTVINWHLFIIWCGVASKVFCCCGAAQHRNRAAFTKYTYNLIYIHRHTYIICRVKINNISWLFLEKLSHGFPNVCVCATHGSICNLHDMYEYRILLLAIINLYFLINKIIFMLYTNIKIKLILIRIIFWNY